MNSRIHEPERLGRTPKLDALQQQSFAPLWTPLEAAAYLRLHEKTVVRLAREKVIPALRLGKHWRFRIEDLTAWAAAQVESIRQPDRVMET